MSKTLYICQHNYLGDGVCPACFPSKPVKQKSILVKQIANFPFSTLSEEKLRIIHAAISAGTTTICPECLNIHLLELRTLNQKICSDCGTQIEWKLEKGQKPLL